MEVSPFNTLEWAERLERAGYDREQARALVRVKVNWSPLWSPSRWKPPRWPWN
jgi:hypothetical protein